MRHFSMLLVSVLINACSVQKNMLVFDDLT